MRGAPPRLTTGLKDTHVCATLNKRSNLSRGTLHTGGELRLLKIRSMFFASLAWRCCVEAIRPRETCQGSHSDSEA